MLVLLCVQIKFNVLWSVTRIRGFDRKYSDLFVRHIHHWHATKAKTIFQRIKHSPITTFNSYTRT